MAKSGKENVSKKRRIPVGALTVESVGIDYPQQNETVTSPDYVIRVAAPMGASEVEISLNQGPWQACRAAAGYWWFDWSGYSNGEHEVVARCQDASGRLLRGTPHEFFVAR